MLLLDHLAVAAETLAEGRAVVEDALGVPLRPGGRHAHFGTHNLLLGLEDGLYLEVIAVDPGAPRPPYPRWFDLDRFAGRPRPTNWICRTEDLAGLIGRFPQAGAAVALSRGDLRWQMAVPDTGILPFDNCFPPLIEWQGTTHPAARLEPSGCSLVHLAVSHPQATDLARLIEGVFQDPRVTFQTGPAGLTVEFDTPHGPRILA